MVWIGRCLKWLGLGLLALWLLISAWAYRPAEPGVPARSLAGPEDRFLRLGDLDLRYRVWGEPKSGHPDIVLIHGFANSVQTFRLLGPALAEDHHVIALDLPGFGLSSKPVEHDYHNPSQARVVGEFIRAMKLERPVIGGHSLGGAIALHVALNEPGIHGMLLLNPGILSTGVPGFTEYLFFPLPRLAAIQFGNREFRKQFLTRSFLDPSIVTEEMLDELQKSVATEDYLTGATSMMGQYVAGEEIPLLNQVTVPVLMVWGEQDRGKPAGEANQLQSLIPGSRLVKVAAAGHYVHEEKPEAVAEAIRQFRADWNTGPN